MPTKSRNRRILYSALLAFSVVVFALLGCTSSNQNISSNSNYKGQFNTPGRNAGPYGNPAQGAGGTTTKQAERPVIIMQLSFETGTVEVNQPYNVYATVYNPDKKDIRYQWTVTSGKLLPALSEDKDRLTKLAAPPDNIDAQPGGEGAPAGADAGASPPGAPTIDGKTVPPTTPPDQIQKPQIPGGPGGGPTEPIPPPQLQGQQPPTDRTEPQSPTGTKIAPPEHPSGHMQPAVLTAALFSPEHFITQAVLALKDDGKNKDDSSSASGDTTADSATSSADTASGDASAGDSAAKPADEGKSDATSANLQPEPDAAASGDASPPAEPPATGDATAGGKGSDTGKTETLSRPTWPTPWDLSGKPAKSEGEKLIQDIQGQITKQIEKSDAEKSLEIKDKSVVTFTTSEPFVRYQPDTAEGVTISVVVVNGKGVKLTEPTVLDVDVKTPQPAIDVSYTAPKEGLQPGDPVDVTLNVNNVPDFRRGLLGITFDVNNFSVGKVKLGNLFGDGRSATLFYAQPDKSSGLVTIAISLEDIIRSVRGSGEAAIVTFEAKAPIPAETTDLGFGVSDEASSRYIQDTAGDNQLPPSAKGLKPLQTDLVMPPPPPAPEAPAAGAEGQPTAGAPGGQPGVGGAPPAGGGAPLPGAGGQGYYPPPSGGKTPPAGAGAPPAGTGTPPATAPTNPGAGDQTTPPAQNTGGQNPPAETPPPSGGSGPVGLAG